MHRLLALLALVALTGFLAACGDDDSDADDNGSGGQEVAEVEFVPEVEDVPDCYEEPEEGNLTIGFSSPLDANETVNVEGRAMKLETEALGGEFILQDAAGDVDAQISGIEQMVAQQVDGLIVFPLDQRALTPVLRRAQNAGIPVVGIEMNLESTDPGPGVDTQVWQQRDLMSYLQAQATAERLPEGSTIGQIGFVVPVPTIQYQNERAKFWLSEFGIESVAQVDNQTDDIAGGEQAMTQLLSRNPAIEGVVAYNEESATGANATVRAQGAGDLVLIGNNGGSLGFSSVEAGTIDATVQIQVPDVGRCAVWGAYDLAQGKDVPEAVAPGEPKVITSDTIDEVPTWEETLEERYGATE